MAEAARRQAEVIGIDTRRRGPVVVEDDAPQDMTVATVTIGDDGSLDVEIKPSGGAQAESSKDDSFDRNLALDMDQTALNAICSWLLDGVESDRESRREWEDTANVAAKYLGVKLEDPTTSVSADGTVSKTIASCMLEALTKLWSTARAELLPVGGPIKVRDDQTPLAKKAEKAKPAGGIAAAPPAAPNGVGAMPPETPPTHDELAESLQADLNHYLTVRDKEYYPDFSKMLLNRALVGMAFRKVYRCPLRRRPVSVWVKAQDLIVSNDCSHLQGAGRITEVVKIRQSTMRRLMVAGAYRDVALVQPTGQVTPTELAVAETEGIMATSQLPSDYEHMVYEVRSEIGSTASANFIGDLAKLDKDETGKAPGYPLPYRIAIDLDSREILEIRRNWKKGDKDHHPKRTYVKYGFIPGIGFYDWGLIHLTGNPTQAATMLQRAGVDATLFANFPGGIFLKGPASRQSSTVVRPNPGEFQGVDGGGASKIQDVFMPLPYRDPSANVIALQSKFENDVRRLAGAIEIPVGEGRIGNTPVGTIMSYIESISMVPSAVHKDDHISQQEEYEMLRDLFVDEPDALIAGNRTPARAAWTAEELMLPDLVPAADPNTPSTIHRLMKIQGRVTLGGMPQFQGIADNRAIYKDAMRVLGGDPDEFTLPEAPPAPAQKDPKVIAAEIRDQTAARSDATKAHVAQVNADAKVVAENQETEQHELDRQSEEIRAALKAEGQQRDGARDDRHREQDRLHDTVNQHLDRQQADQHKAADLAAQPPGSTF